MVFKNGCVPVLWTKVAPAFYIEYTQHNTRSMCVCIRVFIVTDCTLAGECAANLLVLA